MASRPAWADTATIPAIEDETIYDEGELSNGAGELVLSGTNDTGARRRGLVAFDLKQIPAGATITSAKLTLWCESSPAVAGDVSLFRVTGHWGEGAANAAGDESVGAAALPGDATWTKGMFPGMAWTAPGGDHASAASAVVSIGAGAQAYVWSGAGLVADVQSWLDTPDGNHGWELIGNEAVVKTLRSFASRENATAAHRPVLEVVFTPKAAGTGACCTVDAAATCTTTTQAACVAGGGAFQGDTTACSPNPCHVVLTPFVDPLPLPAVATPKTGVPGGKASYHIAWVERTQKLHSQLPPTRVWGYDDGTTGGTYPGPTIEASTGQEVEVTWANDLRDATGALRKDHYFKVDKCVHGATDGPPRGVVHLHGGHVPAAYDGYPESTLLPGEETKYVYPNGQDATTLWYHDHAMGTTRLNVMMGLAAFYLIRSPEEKALGLPSGQYEVPLAIQDRTFKNDGSLFYPDMWMEHFFGDKILVNGKVWPYLEVARGKYRFRLLNGCNARTLTLALSDGAPFWQIGSDGGLLAAPVKLTELTIAPGERADVVMDFSGYAPGTTVQLKNSAPVLFPGFPGVGVIPDVMKFVVTAAAGQTAPLPSTLRAITPLPEAQAVTTRDISFAKSSDPCTGSHWMINGLPWETITENPKLGTSEVWRLINPSQLMHPMHLHLVMFQVLDKQPLTMVNGVPTPTGKPTPPPPGEAGWKDTIQVQPNEVVRIIARFEHFTGKYPYHCHILEHEENMMMRQFEVTAGCGDGVVSAPTETCDPPSTCPTSCDDKNACTKDALSGSASACDAKCEHTPITACAAGDGCCPAGCTSVNDADCSGAGGGGGSAGSAGKGGAAGSSGNAQSGNAGAALAGSGGAGAAGTGGAAGASGQAQGADADDGGGCGCRTPGQRGTGMGAGWGALAGLLVLARRLAARRRV